MPDAFNPYQPPASSTYQDSVPATQEPAKLASRSDRLGAAMIDGIIGMVTIVPLQFAFQCSTGFRTSS